MGVAALVIGGLLSAGAFGDVAPATDSGSSASSDAAAVTAPSSASSDATTTSSATYSPTIASDKADYAPGETVTITGSGWPAQDAIVVQTDDAIGKTWSDTGHVTSDDNGNFTYSFPLPNTFISNYTTTASDLGGLSATTTFTDANLATLQGQQCVLSGGACTGVGDGVWTSQQLACSPTPCTGWRELDSIPTRVLFQNGPATGKVITVQFDHTKTSGNSTFKGFQDLSLGGVLGSDFTVSPNVTITSGPTLSAPIGQDVWSYSFTVDFTGTGNDTGYVQFISTLSAGAHYFTGSSLTLGGSPSLGNLQIHVPAAKPGTPDLSVTKTGPAATSPGQTINYVVNYQNKSSATSPATGVQLTDTFPAALTYVPNSCSGSCTVAGNTVTWNLGTLAPGATGSRTYQATVSSSAANNSTFSNSAQILSAENDANLADNTSSVPTTVYVPSISGTVLNDANGDGADNDGGVGVAGAQVKLYRDGNGNGSFNGAPTDPLMGSVTTDATGGWTFSGVGVVAVNNTYFVVRTNAPGYTSTNAINETNTTDNSTATKISNDQIKVVLGALPTFSANNKFLEKVANQAPTANNDSYSTNEDTTAAITAPGVLGNDTDPNGDALTAVLDSGPSHASSFTLNSDGSFSYTPAADYNGSDSFTYHASDGSLSSGTATVSITVNPVNDPPVVDLNGAGSGTGYTNTFTEDGGAVAAADATAATISDVDNANLASLTITLSNHPDGTAESLAVSGCDVSITVAAYNSTSGVLALTGSSSKANYQACLRSLKYNNTSQNPDTSDRSVSVVANDGSADSATATATIHVVAVNDPPVAVDDSATTNEDTAVDTVVSANDTDVDNANSSLRVKTGSIANVHGGTAVLQLDGRTVRFTPAANANDDNTPGGFGYTYVATDGSADSANSATVTIHVTPVNDHPTLTFKDANGATITSASGVYSDPIGPITVVATDIDSPGTAIDFSATNLPGNLTLAANADGTATVPGTRTATISGGLNVACAGTQPSGQAACTKTTPYNPSITATDHSAVDPSSSQYLPITVVRESASISFDNTPPNVTVATAGGTFAPTITMTISEDADGNLGKDLSTNGLVNAKPIDVSLSPVGSGSGGSCSANNTTYSPTTSLTATASCTTGSLAVNVYEIDAAISSQSQFYAGTGVGVITVMDPSLGFTTGGGWFNYTDPANAANNAKVNFGFNAKVLKSGQVQGAVLTIFKRSNGNYIVKSNSMGGLAISQLGSTTPAHYSASLTGKATYAVPITDPKLVTPSCTDWKCGNYTFTVYVEDLNEPGANYDRYWIQVKDPTTAQNVVPKASINGTAFTSGTQATNWARTILGGNIQVPQPQGGK